MSQKLPKDIITLIALRLDLDDILIFCQANKRFYQSIYLSDSFWLQKYGKRKAEIMNGMTCETSEVETDLTYLSKVVDCEFAYGLYYAAKKGYKDLIDFNIGKGTRHWNMGLYGAVMGNKPQLVKFFIDKGAWNYDWALLYVSTKGYSDIYKLLKQKMKE